MRPIRRILVAVKDPGARSLPAVTKGAQLARALGAHLELFHSLSNPLFVDQYTYASGETIQQLQRRIRAICIERLESVAANLRSGGLRVDVSATWDFPIYEAVVRRANRDKSDLIIAERHAKRHIVPGLLHLTDWELLRMSTVPVLLVKSAAAYAKPNILAAVDAAHTLGKPASLDREILRLAAQLATVLRGQLHAVNAYNPMPVAPAPVRLLSEDSVRKVVTDTQRAAERSFLRTLRAARASKARRHLLGRHPIDAIEQTARSTHSGIVVMGAVARSGFKRLFFGNTAEALLDSLKCDILIVKPAEFAPRVSRRIRGARLAASLEPVGF